MGLTLIATRVSGRRRLPTAMVGAALLSISFISSGSGGETTAGCSAATRADFVESTAFTPGDLQRRPIRIPAPLNPAGDALSLPTSSGVAPTSLGGLPLQFAIARETRLKLYYLGRPVDKLMTPDDFFSAGGLRLEHEPRLQDSQFETFAEDLLQTAGDRALPVEIGPYQGALVWADPTPTSDLRTHNVYWSDGVDEYALVGVAEPDAIVNIARSIACTD